MDILEYEKNVMFDTVDDDVLFVTARYVDHMVTVVSVIDRKHILFRGMGLERLFINHLFMYSDQVLLNIDRDYGILSETASLRTQHIDARRGIRNYLLY